MDSSRPVLSDATSRVHGALEGGFGVWVSAATASEKASTEEDAIQFAQHLWSLGVRLVMIESRTLDDMVIFPSVTHRVLNGDADLLKRLVAANRSQGIETVAVVPLFLGFPRPGEAPVEFGWDPASGRAILTERRLGPEDLPYRSLFAADAQTRISALLDEICRVEELNAVCLSHAGFPNHMTDFRPEARASFERLLGERVAAWPESILMPGELDNPRQAKPGPYWKKWAYWRTSVVSTLLLDRAAAIRGESQAEFGQPFEVSLMANAYPDQRLRTGVHWASLTYEEEPGVGEIFDRLFLEAFVPIVTRQEAAAASLKDSASLEDVFANAAEFSPPTVERWVVISLVPYLDADGRLTPEKRRLLRSALTLANHWKVPVVMMDYEMLTRLTVWEDVRSALQPEP